MLLDKCGILIIKKKPPEVFCKEGVRKNFAKFAGKHMCQNLFLTKVQAETCNFIIKEILTQVFPGEFCNIFNNTFFIEHLRWLLLTIKKENLSYLS